MSSNKIAITIALLSLVMAFFVNELNLHHLKKETPEKVRYNQTIVTADDLSYLVPPKNFIEKGEWKDNSIGKSAYFLRPPGYGLLYMPFYYLFGFEGGLLALKIIQLILYGLSIYCLYKTLEFFINRRSIIIITTCVYGVFPIAMGFLYYSISEGITPAFVIFYIYFLVKGFYIQDEKKKNNYYLLASLVFTYLIIIRPVLLILGVVLPVFLWYDFKSKISQSKMLFLFIKYGLISISLMLIWEVRVFNLTDKFNGLHPIYYEDSNSIYRPTHQHIWAFTKCWGISSDKFHEHIGPIWQNAINDDTLNNHHIDEFIKIIPNDIINELGQDKIYDAFVSYQSSVRFQKSFFNERLPMPTTNKLEQITISKFDNLTNTYKKNHWFAYYIKVPFKYFKNMIAHSNLSLHIFQDTYRGNMFMESIRVISFSIHVSIFLLFFLIVFLKLPPPIKSILAVAPFIYIVFLTGYHRELEERYTLPILSLLLISSAILINFICNKILSRH